jgi:hypothetical protein
MPPDGRRFRKRIIIGGLPRSGSSLVRTVIDASQTIVSPDETGFFLRPFDERRKPAVLERSAARVDRALGIGAERAASIIAKAAGELECFDTLMSAFADSHGIAKDVWAEKTPRNCEHYDRLARLDGNLLFISTVREARGVLTSIVDAERGYHCTIERFCDVARRVIAFRHPRHMVLRFESLVSDPENTLREVFRFIDEPFDAGMLERYREPAPTTDALAARRPITKQPINAARMNAWRDPRHAERLREIEASSEVGAMNIALGYRPE